MTTDSKSQFLASVPRLPPRGSPPPFSLDVVSSSVSRVNPSRLFPVIDAPGRAGFSHDDLRERREEWGEPLPDPAGEMFTGGIGETVDVVEVTVIQLVVNWLERGLDVGKIHNPAGRWIEWPRDVDLDPERVTMQSATFVTVRNIRKEMRGFKRELFKNFHVRLANERRLLRLALPCRLLLHPSLALVKFRAKTPPP